MRLGHEVIVVILFIYRNAKLSLLISFIKMEMGLGFELGSKGRPMMTYSAQIQNEVTRVMHISF